VTLAERASIKGEILWGVNWACNLVTKKQVENFSGVQRPREGGTLRGKEKEKRVKQTEFAIRIGIISRWNKMPTVQGR